MGLFDAMSKAAAIRNDVQTVKAGRAAIFNVRDKLRGTPQFSEIFYSIIGNDVNHPPRHVEGNQSGGFWTEAWDPSAGNYEPFSTQKLQDDNVGYIEGCAVYLLIQECYPNVYDFPSNTTTAIQNGATIKLIMNKQFIGKALKPATVPAAPVVAAPPQAPVQAPAANGATPAFCSACGSRLAPGAAFCGGCGSKVR